MPGEDWKNVNVTDDSQENKPTQTKLEANTPTADAAAQEHGHHHDHGM